MQTLYICLALYFATSSVMALMVYKRAKDHPMAIIGRVFDYKKYLKAMSAILAHTFFFGPISFTWHCITHTNKNGK